MRKLPEFESPPVIEVVFGVLFESLQGLMAPHLGILWKGYLPEFVTVEERPIIAPLVKAQEGSNQVFSLEELSFPRIFFIDKTGNFLVQIQKDRFHFNWRKVQPDDEYPRFETLLPKFISHFESFLKFVDEQGFGQLQISHFELSYHNHIPKGEGWDGAGSLGGVFPDLSWRDLPKRFFPLPEALSANLQFSLPNDCGKLRVKVRKGVRTHDGTPVIVFEQIAQGLPGQETKMSPEDWFLLAREWIVEGFADLTDPRVQDTAWGRKNGSN